MDRHCGDGRCRRTNKLTDPTATGVGLSELCLRCGKGPAPISDNCFQTGALCTVANKTPPSLEAEGLSQSVCEPQGRGCSRQPPPSRQPDPLCAHLGFSPMVRSSTITRRESTRKSIIHNLTSRAPGCRYLVAECENICSLPDASRLTGNL